jgi:hypothetical protein
MIATFAFFALLLVVLEYAGLPASRAPRTPALPAWAWVAALVATYAMQLGLVWYGAHHQSPVEAWRALMPLAVVDDRGFTMAGGDLVTAAMLAFAALQSYALLALYRAQPSRELVWIGCGAMLVLSLAAPALTSFDLYGYVHDAQLGLAAYAPPAAPFAGEYHVFDLWWQTSTTTLYGPLWLVVVRIVTAAAPTLLWKMLALRAWGACLFVALLVALHALGLPARVRNVAALNCGLMFQYVANGHNDLIAIALLAVAAVLIRTRVPVALALVAIAGLVKLPYVLLGLPVLVAIRPVWVRVTAAIAIVAAVAAGSWFGAGAPYANALLAHVGRKSPSLIQYAAAATAIVLVAMAFFGLRRLRSAAWILPTIGSWMFAWYFIWGLPYALARRRLAGYVLVCFPFVAMLLETSFWRWWEAFIVLPLVVLLSVARPKGAAQSAAKLPA